MSNDYPCLQDPNIAQTNQKIGNDVRAKPTELRKQCIDWAASWLLQMSGTQQHKLYTSAAALQWQMNGE